MGEASGPRLAKALFNFKPSNTDELSFLKGDVITITQTEDGGWWEGTLRDHTGWFPSNYVKDIKDSRAISPNPQENTAFYHNVVLESLIETERRLVKELQVLLQDYLRPLQKANIISANDYSHLVGNLEELTEMHQKLLHSLDECYKKPLSQQRIGGVFMRYAPDLENLYKNYCANHPKAVQVLHKHRDELCAWMERAGAPPPGNMWLTTSLSLPFSRLEKYPNLLKEVERHTDKGHVDRGNTQRAISVYREIATTCAGVRKQKELEFELMSTPIRGWEGESINSLGEVLLMSHMLLCDHGVSEKRERLFVLFPAILVMLSSSSHHSGYTFEGKIPLVGMTATQIEESDALPYTNAFEIHGSHMEKKIIQCVSTAEQKQWLDMLRKESKMSSAPHKQQQPRAHNIQMTPLKQPQMRLSNQNAPKNPPRVPPMRAVPKRSNSLWSMHCLRPCPPLRPMLRDEDGRANKGFLTYRKRPIDDRQAMDEDSLILQVIEAYCTSAKSRHTVNSLDLRKLRLTDKANLQHLAKTALLDSPQMLIAEDEKIMVEEIKGDHVVLEEKSLVDTVYELRDKVKELQTEQDRIKRELEEGRKSNTRLETLVRKTLGRVNNVSDGTGSGGGTGNQHYVNVEHESESQTV